MVQHVFSICKVLDLILSTIEKEEEEEEGEEREEKGLHLL